LNRSLLLDTHIAIWLNAGDLRLRPATRALIETCVREGGTAYFSAISAWEIAVLADLKRLFLDVSPDQWVKRFVSPPGIEVVPLSPMAAARSYELPGVLHRDPADRLLIATAIELACPLVTYDAPLVAYAARHGDVCGFSVER
jgi:PIN domain nuclease of toxin-antitoxin system